MTTDPLADRPDLIRVIDGQRMLTPKAMAVLFGITEAEVDAEYDRQKAQAPEAEFTLPKDWMRRGKEITARLGTNNRFELLHWLLIEQEINTSGEAA